MSGRELNPARHDWARELQSFKQAQTVEYGETTARTRTRAVAKLGEWVTVGPWQVTPAHIAAYLAYGREVRDWKRSTLYAVRAALHAFYRWGEETGKARTNPMTGSAAPAPSGRGAEVAEMWGDAIDAYREHLLVASSSTQTRRLRVHQLQAVARAMTVGPWEVTAEDLGAYMAAGFESHAWKRETARSVRSALKAFYTWARREGHVSVNPAEYLPAIHAETPAPRPCPDDVISGALSDAQPSERLMILLGAYCGLRRAEIARVHGDDWDGHVLAVAGKGGKKRAVPVVIPELRRALDAARKEGAYLFPSPARPGQPVTPDYVSRHLSALLPHPYTVHTLRHRFATVAYAGARDLLAVGAVLGHSRPETTKRYVRVPTADLDAVAIAAAGHRGTT